MSWWGEGLYRGLPSSLRQLFRADMPRLGLHLLDNNRLAVSWNQDGKRQACGEYHLSDGAFDFKRVVKKHARSKKHLLELMLNDKQALRLQHAFPEAVQDNLKQVIGYQLDRLTPFSMDSAYFDAQLVRHDKIKKEIIAAIYVTPKLAVDKLYERLQAAGVPPIDVLSTTDQAVNLTHGLDHELMVTPERSRIPFYFFMAALILALAAPVLYKQRRFEQIEGAIADLKKSAASQLDVRDKLLAAEEALSFLQERRKTSPVMLEIVEQLSAEIPAHTWLERLEINGRQIQLRGESNKALTLIDSLEESPHFSRVSFKSPVTRSKNTGKDQFQIQATVEDKP